MVISGPGAGRVPGTSARRLGSAAHGTERTRARTLVASPSSTADDALAANEIVTLGGRAALTAERGTLLRERVAFGARARAASPCTSDVRLEVSGCCNTGRLDAAGDAERNCGAGVHLRSRPTQIIPVFAEPRRTHLLPRARWNDDAVGRAATDAAGALVEPGVGAQPGWRRGLRERSCPGSSTRWLGVDMTSEQIGGLTARDTIGSSSAGLSGAN